MGLFYHGDQKNLTVPDATAHRTGYEMKVRLNKLPL